MSEENTPMTDEEKAAAEAHLATPESTATPPTASEDKPKPRSRRKGKDAEDPGDPDKRYAAYNKSLGRYVGGVRDTKAEADKIAEQITEAGHTAEIREF